MLDKIGKVRLIGVNTPETKDPRRPVQYFGKEASQFLKDTVTGKKVRPEYDQQKKDKYQRTLAYIYLEDGTLVNGKIIREGYGFAYTRFPFRQMEKFREYEKEAREKRRGLWADAAEKKVSPFKYSCISKKCKDIKTCEEAKFLLSECGFKHLDRNGDGQPCESLCH